MQICQWAEEDILGSHFSIFYTNSDVEGGRPQQHLEEARDVGWSEEEGLRLRKDGTKFRAAMQLTAIREENGQHSGFLCVLRDVTERYKAQEALQQANQMLTSAIDASPLPIITLDAATNVRQWNPAAEKMFGWAEEEVLGKPLPTVPESEREGFQKLLSEQAGGKRIVARELVRLRKDGTTLPVSIWTAPLFDSGGNMSGVMGIFLDLSDRQRAAEEAKKINESLERRVTERTQRLEEANEELAAFSYTVSHDLRLPLRSLQMLATMLLETQGEKLDEVGRATASRLVGATARMERQIDDLLEYSKSSRGELKTEPVSLILVVHELLGRVQRDPMFADAQIIVTEPLGWVVAHHMTLERVILNILSNALTFVRPGAKPIVNIRAQEKNGFVRLCIEDNGIGIPLEDRERIFHVFERLPAAEAYPGLGIGLTIARRGVERMGGKIFVQPVESGGTEFIIELPNARKPA
jgi:PAS domain S-box-containing protein